MEKLVVQDLSVVLPGAGEHTVVIGNSDPPRQVIIGITGVSQYFRIGRKRAGIFIKKLFPTAIIAGEGYDVVIDLKKSVKLFCDALETGLIDKI